MIEVLENANSWEDYVIDVANEDSTTKFLSQETNEKEAA